MHLHPVEHRRVHFWPGPLHHRNGDAAACALADRVQHGGIAEGSRVAVHLKFEAFAANAFGGIDSEDQLEVDRFRPGRQDEQQEEQDPDPDHSVPASRRGGSAQISVIRLRTIA